MSRSNGPKSAIMRLQSLGAPLLLLLACYSPCVHGESSYKEMLDEEADADLTTVQKNAAAFVRAIEHATGGRRLTRAEVQKVYADKVAEIRDDYLHHQQSRLKMIEFIRAWTNQIAPLLHHADHPQKDKHVGPLHDVLDTASEILGIEHEDGLHPHNQAKEIMVGIQLFTEAIVEYYNKRGYDHEDKQEL